IPEQRGCPTGSHGFTGGEVLRVASRPIPASLYSTPRRTHRRAYRKRKALGPLGGEGGVGGTAQASVCRRRSEQVTAGGLQRSAHTSYSTSGYHSVPEPKRNAGRGD